MDRLAIARDMIAKSAEAVRESERLVPTIVRVAELIDAAFQSGHRLYVCGNGGSAADAQHFAAELVGRFTRERTAYPAVALTTNTSVLTAIGNDYEFAEVFARQVRALVRPGDVLVGISTSGRSENVIRALGAAPSGTTRVALMGGSGPMAELADVVINAPGNATAEIQTAHITLVHAICAVLDMLADA